MDPMRPNIFESFDYRAFLRALYLYKKQKDHLSYRSFSRAAGFRSSNFLKLVIDGKRNISESAIHRFAKALRLTKGETDFFEALVLFNQARTSEEKKHHYERIARFKAYNDYKALEVNQYAYFSNWYFVALRELVLLKDFREDPKWINRKLKAKLHPEEIRRAVEILIDLKLLKRDSDGRLRQTAEKITTTPEMGSLAIINFHREMLHKASFALEGSRTAERDISGLTVSISKMQFERIRERLNQFRQEIHAIANEESEREAVYQLNLQLFNLSEVPWR